MEIRIEKKKKYPFPDRRKLHKIWKILLAGLVICLLVGGMVWQLGRRATAQAEGENKYNMDTVTVTENGVTKTKYVFNVVEVVPQASQAILGLFISGQEDKIISLAEIQSFVNQQNTTYRDYGYKQFFYFSSKEASSGIEPFTVIENTGTVVNNEIFKLYMLGIGKIDFNLSPYDNLEKNKDALKTFDDQFKISYHIVTPEKLTSEMIEHTQYLHVGSGWQIQDISNLYKKTGHSDLAELSAQKFVTDITSFSLVNKIYKRAISKDNRLSISINVYPFWNDNGGNDFKTRNIYKLYWMLNHFNDTGKFEEFYKDGELGKGNKYIDEQTGDIVIGSNKYSDWTPENLNKLSNAHNYPTASYYSTRPGNYIPEGYDNILLYNSQGGIGNAGFFESRDNIRKTSGSGGDINSILNFNKYKPSDNPQPEPQDKEVKVLEIEPCTDFRFQNNEAEQSKLASWLNVSATSIEYTFVTPNELNGMTVDLVSEYDMIYIGDRVGKMGTSTQYVVPVEHLNTNLPYQHIGAYKDSVITQTLINGLLDKDKTDAEKFKILSKKELTNSPTGPFLQNTGLALALGASSDSLGHARFSGNDITVYMKEQLKEYADSGQPIVVASSVMGLAETLSATDIDKRDPNKSIDANMYVLLTETRLSGTEKIYDNIFNEKECGPGKVYLLKDDKPTLYITDTRANGTESQYIMAQGTEEALDIATLKKSNVLEFGYRVDNMKPGSQYNLKVIIDQNGDGVFDEEKAGVEEKKDAEVVKNERKDIIYSVILDNNSDENVFLSPGPIQSVKEMCQFRVIVEEKNGSLRTSWTGFMRPDLSVKRNVKVLQITSDVTTGIIPKKLVDNTAFNEVLAQVPCGEGNQPDYQFDFTDTVSATDFSYDFGEEKSLEPYDLIIVGFDYGQYYTEIESPGLDRLNDYIQKQKKPVIFTSDTISYVNMEPFKAPDETKFIWQKMTKKDEEEWRGKYGDLKEDENHRRIELTKEEYELYRMSNEKLVDQGKEEQQTYLQEWKGRSGEYEAVYLPILKERLNGKRREEAQTITFGQTILWIFSFPNRDIMSLSKVHSVAPKYLQAIFEKLGYEVTESGESWQVSHSLTLSWITKDEYDAMYSDERTLKTEYALWRSDTFKVRNFVLYPDRDNPAFIKTKTLDANEVKQKTDSSGAVYYVHHGEYLARKIADTEVTKYGYWEQKVEVKDSSQEGELADKQYHLANVAGNGDLKSTVLYPDKTEWNHTFTQAMRSTLGMDRFGITWDSKTTLDSKADPKTKRDSGTIRDKKAPEEIQGFTNGALLEYACITDENGNVVIQNEPYEKSEDVLPGTAPRTDCIEQLNVGVIGNYPFKIQIDEDNKLIITEKHAPYYQLDLEKQFETNKTDNVCVWYTLSGSATSDVMKKSSKYFDLTRRDARNNYYLYSKGNVFYTAYNLPENSSLHFSDLSEAQQNEMQLFVNTLYAALSSEASKDVSYYNTVIKSDGAISALNLSEKIGSNNHYVCYYDKDDDKITIRFRIQKQAAQENEPSVRVDMGYIDMDGGDTLEEIKNRLPTEAYTLPEGLLLKEFPVMSVPELGVGDGSGLSPEQISDVWYELTIPFKATDENLISQEFLDGKVILIATMEGVTGDIVKKDAIHAEIRFVMRDLFELD